MVSIVIANEEALALVGYSVSRFVSIYYQR